MTSGEDSLGESRDDTIVISGFVSGAFFAERYRLERLLGAGAMGKVYAATDMASDRQVALKVLHPDKALKEKVIQRFRREAEILHALGHPGIVRVLDAGQSKEGTDFIAHTAGARLPSRGGARRSGAEVEAALRRCAGRADGLDVRWGRPLAVSRRCSSLRSKIVAR